jgi:FixJ family two-component response regulator
MTTPSPKVFLVDDEPFVRLALARVLRPAGYEVAEFASASRFLETVAPEEPGCMLLDVAMPELTGLQMQQALAGSASERAIVFLSGQYDVRSSVQAMKAGAVDFLTKPVERNRLLAAVSEATRVDTELRRERAARCNVQERVALLTRREKEVFSLVVHGRLNKQIAADLGTVEKTVKVHRARVMKKMRVRTLADLVLTALLAGVADRPRTRPPNPS